MPDETTPPTDDYLPSSVPTPRRTREKAGDRIGTYKLLQKLGEGGMGAVWHAEQTAPVRRQVALKLIRPDFAADHFLARFEAERQALALMDHPNIAKVFDAGTTESGAPYLVMEFVKGVPFTKYCDNAKLTIRERVQLFVPVCRAVQHAHTKGIIHRDLKPSNIMVALYEGVPVPKIIDFGIAKALHQKLTEKTLVTQLGTVIGTPEYMAPEQAELNALDIDTRADVYSLGVILYETLAGSPPFDRRQFESFALLEILRLVKEAEPPPPSKKLSSVHTLPEIAAKRRVEPLKLGRLIRGELDWVVMKALEKERGRRYTTADLFAADLEHYLADEPVAAGPPSAGYRLKKTFRRHRGRIIAAGLLFVSLVGGLIAASAQAYRATRAEGRLENALGDLQVSLDEKTNALQKEAQERQRADDRTAEAAKARDGAEYEAYVANLVAADASHLANEPGRVRVRLDACPEPRRNWEWQFMNARADESLIVLRGHRSEVKWATFSPTGDRVVAVSSDTIPRVWDVVTGKELVQFRGGPDGTVKSASFSAEGDRVVTAAGKTARVWDAATGKELAVLRGHDSMVMSASFSAAGDRIVTAAHDKTARVWDADTGKELAVLRGHEINVTSATFSPAGDRVVTASYDRSARVWDAATGKELAVLRGHASWVTSASFNPAGDRVVTASNDRTARLWDPATGNERAVMRGHDREVISALFNLAGNRIVTASIDKSARVWDAATGNELAVMRGHEDEVKSALFSPTGDRVTTAGDKTARVWDAATGKELVVLRGHDGPVMRASFNATGNRIVTASSDWTARVWDAAMGKELRSLRRDAVKFASFSPSGDRIVTGAYGSTARVRDATTDEQVMLLLGHDGPVMRASFNSAGDRIVTASFDKTARVWDATTGKELAVLRGHVDVLTSASFSLAGDRVVTTAVDKTARVWDAATGKELAVLRGHTGPVVSASFNPAGNRIVTASQEQMGRVWDSASGEELAVLRGGQILTASFSPTGDRVVTGSADRIGRMWDAVSVKELVLLRGHESPVRSALFSPTGDRVVTASVDNTARVWDAATGAELALLRGHENAVVSASFNPAGDRVVTASHDKTARVWDARTGKELALLRGHVTPVWGVSFSPAGDQIVTATQYDSHLWHSRPYRERYPAIAASRAARKTMTERLTPRIKAGEDLDAIVQSLVDDKSLDETHRRMGLAVVCEERERRWAQEKK